MATGSVSRNAQGIANRAVGVATGDGTALSVAVGFRPMKVELVNLTDATTFEKIDGMSDAQAVKCVTGGALTVDTTSAIVLTDRGFIVSAAVAAAGKSLVWYAD